MSEPAGVRHVRERDTVTGMKYDLADKDTRKMLADRVAGIRYRARLYAAAGQPERAARCLALLNEPENQAYLASLDSDDGRVKRRKPVPA